jgi:hypothetical protein
VLREVKRKNLPWDVAKAVEIPGIGIRIQGQIDRLDLAGDMKRARVIDYKTGQLRNHMADCAWTKRALSICIVGTYWSSPTRVTHQWLQAARAIVNGIEYVANLRVPGLLRRLSWQDFILQWPNDQVLDWLKEELV